MKLKDHLNDSWFQLLYRSLLFGLNSGTHHLPFHHAVLVQRFLVLVKHALFMTLAEILEGKKKKKNRQQLLLIDWKWRGDALHHNII